jgi:hypothetical protein
MMTANHYRTKAAELRREAQRETDPTLRIDCERLAAPYENLAEQMDKAVEADDTPGPKTPTARP